jgi:hypothetical protein
MEDIVAKTTNTPEELTPVKSRKQRRPRVSRVLSRFVKYCEATVLPGDSDRSIDIESAVLILAWLGLAQLGEEKDGGLAWEPSRRFNSMTHFKELRRIAHQPLDVTGGK